MDHPSLCARSETDRSLLPETTPTLLIETRTAIDVVVKFTYACEVAAYTLYCAIQYCILYCFSYAILFMFATGLSYNMYDGTKNQVCISSHTSF